MTMFQAAKSVFSKYAVFQGRARRAEYWKFFLFNTLLTAVLGALAAFLSVNTPEAAGVVGVIMSLYSLACLLPGLALCCRRMHDVNKPGAYILFGLLPVIGTILLIVWAIQDGDPGPNRYGPDPKGRNVYSGGYDAAPARTKRCPHCSSVIDADAAFCTACGKDTRTPKAAPAAPKAAPAAAAASPAYKNCLNCGAKMSRAGAVCPACGKNPDRIEASYSASFDSAPSYSAPSSAPSSTSSRLKISKGLSAPTDLD